MRIEGACHCGNIRFVLEWPGDDSEIAVRSCGCGFCTMHGGTYTSHRDARLDAVVEEPDLLSRYRFGTRTAEFHVCRRCGVVPFVTSQIGGRLYGVANANTFVGIDRSRLRRSVTCFDGETVEGRLERRSRTWIPEVTVREGRP